MARQQEISDEELVRLRKQFTPAQIARKTGLNPSSISRRLRRIEEQGVRPTVAPPVATQAKRDTRALPSITGKPNATYEEKLKLLEDAGISVEFTEDDPPNQPEDAGVDAGDMSDILAAASLNLRRALQLLREVFDPLDVTRAMSAIQRAAEFKLSAHERTVAVEEMRDVVDVFLDVLDEFEPGARARIIERLEERRVLRLSARSNPRKV